MIEELLNEGTYALRTDNTYRKQNRYIIISMLSTITPKYTMAELMRPDTLSVGNNRFTWQEVQSFFVRNPLARKRQLPMHYYAEYLDNDYNIYTGLPFTNTSWVIEKMIDLGVLNEYYKDAILIVLQEDYSVETLDNRILEILAHQVISPYLAEYDISRYNGVFFLERLLDYSIIEEMNNSNVDLQAKYPFYSKEPTYLDEFQLEMFLKRYHKNSI